MKITIFLLFLLMPLFAVANETEKQSKIKLDFSGFLRFDMTYDTRQTVSAREGIYLLYPDKPVWDKDGNDINAASNFNFCTINSNLKFNLLGPDIFRAKTNAFVEVDFWGSESNKYIDLNHIRIRHAYALFKWKTTELLLGQYWNPMCAPGFFPRVVSSNSAVPIHPIARNPQIRVSQQVGLFKFIGSLLTQRDFTSTGPDGPDSKYLRNSGLPYIHMQVQYGRDASLCISGVGIDYKKIVPDLYTSYEDEMIKTGKKNALSCLSFMGFMSVETKHVSARFQGVYARNAHDIQMLGGYALKEVVNAEKGEKEFSNLNTFSGWGDIQTTGKRLKFGVFCGYTKNRGSGEKIDGPLYARGAAIDNVFRISPRIVYERLPVLLSLECEYTTADYGTENGNGKGGVTNVDTVRNWRGLVSVKYSF